MFDRRQLYVSAAFLALVELATIVVMAASR
jgi:hypothetical protein